MYGDVYISSISGSTATIYFVLEDVTLGTYEALRACTYNAAQCLGISDKSGTIEIGKEADFIMLSDNPLDNIKNTEKIEGVFVNKAWYYKAELDSLLYDISEKYGSVGKVDEEINERKEI